MNMRVDMDSAGTWNRVKEPGMIAEDKLAAREKRRQEEPLLKRAEAWLEAAGPDVDGFPVFDVSLKQQFNIKDSFGVVNISINDANSTKITLNAPKVKGISARVAMPFGETTESGYPLSGNLSLAALQFSVDSSGDIKVGLGYTLTVPGGIKLGGYEFKPASAKSYVIINPFKQEIGFGAEGQLLIGSYSMEARVGWGQGFSRAIMHLEDNLTAWAFQSYGPGFRAY